MTTIAAEFLRHEACDVCPSSDAKAVYDDGHTYCFACRNRTEGTTTEATTESRKTYTRDLVPDAFVEIPARRISSATCEKFGYSCHGALGYQTANYRDATGQLVAQKLKFPDKTFRWIGDSKAATLFGQHLWAAGGKRIVVTEGEIDAMSVSQAQGNTWPVVSIKDGAQSARKGLAQHIEYLESFGEIVLLFDMDEPGRRAAAECAELFTPGKAKIGQLPLKDASDMLQAGRTKELVSAVWQAKAYQPDGLIEGAELWDAVVTRPEPGLAYPWVGLNAVLGGQRLREMCCWTGGTGIGKTQILRELAHYLATTHGQRIGYISLEESSRDVALGQMSIDANRRLHLPECRQNVSDAELKNWFDRTCGSGRYLLCDPKWVQPSHLLARIRYMVLGGGCRWILFDHISMTVGHDAAAGDERKRIDELMYQLRALVDELGFGLHYITHLRKKDGTPYEEGGRVSLADFRGSGAIAQVATAAISAERNQQADMAHRNRTTLRVLKNRFSGETDPACELNFDTETGRLVETEILRKVDTRAEVERRFMERGGNHSVSEVRTPGTTGAS